MSRSKATLVFDILTWWHAGTGRGAAAQADAVVIRDPDGLPFLPGRTVKGLVRDAMQRAAEVGALSEERVVELFGSSIPGTPEDSDDEAERHIEASRYTTEPGMLWFGSAQLPKEWRTWARSKSSETADIIDELFHFVASTAIDKEGVALDHTLRVREVAAPMTLRAEIQGPEKDAAWIEDIKASLHLLRCLGTRRQRGYGRVHVTLEVS